jgi:hypothetical protein
VWWRLGAEFEISESDQGIIVLDGIGQESRNHRASLSSLSRLDEPLLRVELLYLQAFTALASHAYGEAKAHFMHILELVNRLAIRMVSQPHITCLVNVRMHSAMTSRLNPITSKVLPFVSNWATDGQPQHNTTTLVVRR